MIEDLQNDDIINKFGGRFKLAALIQRRWHQILQGARPMVETEGLTEMEVVVKEIVEGKIEMEFDGVTDLGDDDETADDNHERLGRL